MRHAAGIEPESLQVSSGDFVSLKPAHVLTHDNTAPVIGKFRQMNGKKMADPSAPPRSALDPAVTGCADRCDAGQPVFALDHDVQNKTDANLAKCSLHAHPLHAHIPRACSSRRRRTRLRIVLWLACSQVLKD